jgi:hypothetical protein
MVQTALHIDRSEGTEVLATLSCCAQLHPCPTLDVTPTNRGAALKLLRFAYFDLVWRTEPHPQNR